MSIQSSKQFADFSDEELMNNLQNGDTECFSELVHRYQSVMTNYLYKYVKDWHLAEDVFQNTWTHIFSRKELYQKEKKVSSWVYTIAHNQAIDALRKKRSRQSRDIVKTKMGDEQDDELVNLVADKSPEPPVALAIASELDEKITAVRRVILFLEANRKVTLELHLEGYAYREIAKKLAIPEGTVKSRIAIAKREILAALPEEFIKEYANF